MSMNRYAVGALVATAALLVGGGTALAASQQSDRSARCDALLAKVAEKRGVSVEQLRADITGRLTAWIDAAEKAGRVSPERADRLRARVTDWTPCRGRHHARAGLAHRGMLGAAARFLELDRKELRAQLPGTSLAALAAKQGKSVEALEQAMLARAKARLAKAVQAGRFSQARADRVLDMLARFVDRLTARAFPAR